jgi:outer membrane usher protein
MLSTAAVADDAVPLILEVRVNGARSPQLWQFDMLPDGSLATSEARLALLGLDTHRAGVPAGAERVRLADLRGVAYRFIEATQSVDIDVPDNVMVPVVLDGAETPTPINVKSVEMNTGAMLNYGVYVAANGDGIQLSTQYEARFLTPYGLLSSSGFATSGSEGEDRLNHVRLDTNWRSVDVNRAIAYTIGDAIGDGGQLGTAYRLGGFQMRRDYGNRPDLVTMALPILSGSAAVPSAIDLYLNNLRYFSGEVGRGPFQFRSLPNIGGGATATIVLTDALGRETRITKPIFFAPGLLPVGALDFSVEAGLPRLNYGVKSFDYLDHFAASGTVRYGLSGGLTLMGHVEGMTNLGSASIAGTVRLGGFGALTAGVAASRFRGDTGIRYSIEGQGRVSGVNLYGAIERSDSNFQDIVTASTIIAAEQRVGVVPDPPSSPIIPVLEAYSRRTERAGVSFTAFSTGFSLGYLRLRLPQETIRTTTATLNRMLFGRVSVWTNAYRDFGDHSDYGIFAGFNISLSRGTSISSSVSARQDGTLLSTRISHTPGQPDHAISWNITANQSLSGDDSAFRTADMRYEGDIMTVGAGAEQVGSTVRATGFAEGSIVAMGGVFFSPRIDSAFAVVRGAGADTPIFSNTRQVARSDANGRALVPSLNSLQSNLVSIDPSNLPVDLRPERTQAVVVPGDRSGVVIDFGVAAAASALIVLVDARGVPLPVGAYITLDGSEEQAVVGYDGRAYLNGLSAHNRIRIQREGAPDCSMAFDFKPVAGQQAQIGPLTCP